MKFNRLILILILFEFLFSGNTHAQTSQTVINNYLEVIGGRARWESLKSRKSVEEEILYSDKNIVEVAVDAMQCIRYYLKPGSYLNLLNQNFVHRIRAYTPNCNWLYSSVNETILFYGEELNSRKTKIPQIGILDILTFPMNDSLFFQDGLYRIDFNDIVWDRVISVYFDKETYKVVKHTYFDRNSVLREYFYSDYRNNGGFIEPYKIEYYVQGAKLIETTIKDIEYNLDINKNIFIAPVDCDQSELGSIKLNEPIIIAGE